MHAADAEREEVDKCFNLVQIQSITDKHISQVEEMLKRKTNELGKG